MKTIFKALLIFQCLNLNSQAPAWAWARSHGGSGWDFSGGAYYSSSAIVTNPLGFSFVTGIFNNSASFGTVSVVSTATQNVFVAKYDPNGNCIWVKNFGGAVNDTYGNQGMSVSLDNSGNCYVTGTIQENDGVVIPIGASSFTGTGMREIFVAKFDGNGNVLWVRQPNKNNTSNNYAHSIVADASGNSYVTGTLGAAGITFGSTGSPSTLGAFVTKYDPNGTVIWAKHAGTSAHPSSITLDNAGNPILTGFIDGFSNYPTVPPSNVSPIGSTDVFVIKFNGAGNMQWIKNFGAPSSGSSSNPTGVGKGVSTDALGNIFVTGDFTEKLIVGTNTLVTGGSIVSHRKSFVMKLNPTGIPLWSLQTVNPSVTGGQVFGTALASTSDGESFITGYYYPASSTTSLCSFSFPNGGNQSLYVAKIDSSGNCVWARFTSQSQGSAMPFGISLDAAKNVYLSGQHQTTSVFGTHTITSAGGFDVLLAKLGNNTDGIPTAMMTYTKQHAHLIYPNPTTGKVYVDLQENSDQSLLLSIYNSIGQRVFTEQCLPEKITALSLDGLAPGIYYYKLEGMGHDRYIGKLKVE